MESIIVELENSSMVNDDVWNTIDDFFAVYMILFMCLLRLKRVLKWL